MPANPASPPKLAWYWHRLRAMSAGEVALRIRKKFRELADARFDHDWAGIPLEGPGQFPALPAREAAPETLRTALRHAADAILAGRWRAFGQLVLKVDDPPRWHCDYLAGKDLATTASAFALDHRALPGGADSKLIWELSRWHALTRLALAAHVLGDEKAGEKCILWLADWVKHNPPFRGWNWTSALESGLRLIQFTWMDALLAPHAERWGCDAELDRLRYEILPAHAWFTWRHQSFGSSANNHLIGELAGLIVATARWPALAQWGAPLAELQPRWEREVLAQFAADGGNKEQALNYHLFSWELCWHARAALLAAGREIAPAVEERLRRAAQFYVDVQVPSDPWDYGDSDNAFVVPLFADETRAVQEWHAWLAQPERSAALDYWWGARRVPESCSRRREEAEPEVRLVTSSAASAAQSGCWMVREGGWSLRWDVSPLGYLNTAAHGHFDALHLSIWLKGVALVVDPGTGAYYGDTALRAWLASRAAHNGPCPFANHGPRRLGPFLWSGGHDLPMGSLGDWTLSPADIAKLACETARPEMALVALKERTTSHSKGGLVAFSADHGLAGPVVLRDLHFAADGSSLVIGDTCGGGIATCERLLFSVRWQFAPGAKLECLAERRFRVTRRGVAMEVEVSADWAEVFAVAVKDSPAFRSAATSELEREFAGIVSPSFRQTEWAPFLKLVARPGEKPCVFTTTFLASARA